MINPINLRQLTPSHKIIGEDDSDTKLLNEMLQRAELYLRSFKWCPPITEKFLGCGVGGVVAAFLFRFAKRINDTDDQLWVIVGDVPSAYFVTDEAPNATTALSIYCDLMEAWAHAVSDGSSLENIFPVAAPATPEYSTMLLSRIRFIREQIIPTCRTG